MQFGTFQPIIIKYPTPIISKCDEIEVEHYVLNWPQGIKQEVPKHLIEKSFTEFHPDISESVQRKIDNTIEFYTQVRGWTGVKSLPDSTIHIE